MNKVGNLFRIGVTALIVALCWQPAVAEETLKLFLVRHAEKVDQSQESALTELGERRALAIAELLASEPLTRIFSTPFNRTLLTARPTADQHGLEITEYDGNQLEEFAGQLRLLEGAVLVVGHSNTTPVLVNHLVGTELPLLEEHEYDRVYVVTLDENGDASLDMQFTQPRTH